MFINGYKYENEQDAIAAIQRINAQLNIGTSEDNVTKNYCTYNIAEYNTPVFYFIVADEQLVSILGYPTPMEVVVEESPFDIID